MLPSEMLWTAFWYPTSEASFSRWHFEILSQTAVTAHPSFSFFSFPFLAHWLIARHHSCINKLSHCVLIKDGSVAHHEETFTRPLRYLIRAALQTFGYISDIFCVVFPFTCTITISLFSMDLLFSVMLGLQLQEPPVETTTTMYWRSSTYQACFFFFFFEIKKSPGLETFLIWP